MTRPSVPKPVALKKIRQSIMTIMLCADGSRTLNRPRSGATVAVGNGVNVGATASAWAVGVAVTTM